MVLLEPVRFLAAAAFLPAATRFGDFRVVAFRVVLRAPGRFLVVVAFLPAARRFGDFRDGDFLVDFRGVDFREAVRLRVAAAFFPAAERFLVAEAFFPAATRFGDFRVVAFRGSLRAPGRFLVVAAFFPAVERFLVVAAFFPTATRFGDVRVVVGRDAVIAPDGVTAGKAVPSGPGIGRSLAGVSGRHAGSRARSGSSGGLAPSVGRVPSTGSSIGRSFIERSSLSLPGRSRSCDGMPPTSFCPSSGYEIPVPPQPREGCISRCFV